MPSPETGRYEPFDQSLDAEPHLSRDFLYGLQVEIADMESRNPEEYSPAWFSVRSLQVIKALTAEGEEVEPARSSSDSRGVEPDPYSHLGIDGLLTPLPRQGEPHFNPQRFVTVERYAVQQDLEAISIRDTG